MVAHPDRTRPLAAFARLILLGAAGFLGPLLAASAASAEENTLPPAAERPVDFRNDVYPILAAHCFECHQGRDASSGYRLDDRAELLGETTGIPLVEAGDSAASRLIRLVAGLDDEKVMPPEGDRLTAKQIGILRAWIDGGLAWDESILPPVLAETEHWAFQPVSRPEVPRVENEGWVRNPVDAFIAARHEKKGLRPAPPASRRTMIRRLSLDLLGLPPTPRETEAFLNDSAPNSYGRLVERMLASPHYGERWGRHWLDVARWAETEGYESNHPRRFAWRYRDWVVASFNDDKPYDEFVRQQVAGDELVPYSDENLIATGFLAAARLSSNEEDKWLQRNQVLVDVTNAVGSAFLGLTVGCAQCHNHKFDPVTTRDYYSLQGYFLPGQPLPVALDSPEMRRRYEAQDPKEYQQVLALKTTIFERGRQRMIAEAKKSLSEEALEAVETPVDQRTVEQELLARRANLKFQGTPGRIEGFIPEEDRKLYGELKKRLAALEKQIEQPQTFAWYSEITSPHDLKVLPQIGFYPLPYKPDELARRRPYLKIRGDVHNIGPEVEPRWPAVFDTVFEFETGEEHRGTRTELARWLTDPRHPLTARVWVNRIWHYHFGRGIVATPGDFGARGAEPTHPRLLDWLAAELIESGWSTKHIHRLILTSNTYRQASTVTDERALEIDPENRFLWHWKPRRLEVEAVRDSMLAAAGELDRTLGGPSVPLEKAGESSRRSLYLYQKRGTPPEMQKLFDGPSEASASCARRHTSTTALQSLYLLNGDFAEQCARRLAARVAENAGDDRARQIELAFRLALNRGPDQREREAARRFFARRAEATGEEPRDTRVEGRDSTGGRAASATRALEAFCLAMLNLNEFLYIE